MAALSLCLTTTLQLEAQIVISEYVEGSGNNKCVEIWNSSGASVDLDDFGYRAYQNGASTPTSDFVLPAVTLPAGGVYVICNPSAVIACRGNADLTDSRIQHNGDDAIALYSVASGLDIDIFGSIGQDPGSQWTGACGHRTSDRTLRRLAAAPNGGSTPSTGFPTLCSDWEQFPLDDCSGLGVAPEEVPMPSCFPIISEVVEGTGNCKFVEIYNPCCEDIDLASYEVKVHYNACTSTNTISLAGILAGDVLASGSTVVLYNVNETCSPYYTTGVYPANFKSSNVLQHNGNDAIVLTYSVSGAAVDIFGNICENTVWSDPICGSSTQDMTLMRVASVCTGVTVDPATGFPTLCSEWEAQPLDEVSDLGVHISDCLEACAGDGKRASTSAEAAVMGIAAFPNPFSASTTVRFQVPATAHTQVAVYDLLGNKVAQLFDASAESGRSYEVSLDAQQLPAGQYICRILSGEQQMVTKLQVVK